MEQQIETSGQGRTLKQYSGDAICALIGLIGMVGMVLGIVVYNLLT